MHTGRIIVDLTWEERTLQGAFAWRVDGWSWGEALPTACETDGPASTSWSPMESCL